MRVSPTPYPDLDGVLRELVESVHAVLGEQFVGAYLQGAFAVGDFDQHSDVDFVIVVQDDLADDEVQALQSMHEPTNSHERPINTRTYPARAHVTHE